MLTAKCRYIVCWRSAVTRNPGTSACSTLEQARKEMTALILEGATNVCIKEYNPPRFDA